jgi:PAS domain S-box-containing protein
MNYNFIIYSAIYLAVSLISFFVAFLAWQRRTVICAKELTILVIAGGLWAFWIIFESAAQTVPWKIFWSKLEYFGAVSAPVLYLIFVLRFTGKGRFITTRNTLLLFIVPVITLLFALTNEKHHLIWSGFSSISEKTNIMEYYHGVWFWIGYLAYNYLLFILATYYLFYFIFYQKKVFRAQGFIIFFAGLCPWIASILYLFGLNPFPGVDLPPISIILSGSLFAFAILYTPFLDLVPVAREKLVEVLPEGILVLDGQNRILDINEAALSFLGIRNKNIIGIQAESSDASVTLLLKAVLDHGTINEIDIKENDEIFTYKITKQTIKSHANSRLIVIHNITEAKRAEASIISLAKRNRTLLLTSKDGIHVLDDQGSVVEINPAFCNMLGYTQEELMKLNVTDWEIQSPGVALLTRVRENIKHSAVFETQNRRKDGSIIDVEISASGVTLDGQNYLYASSRNITERKQLELKIQNQNLALNKLNSDKDRFLSILAHDLRSPFSSLLGLSELLSESIRDNDINENAEMASLLYECVQNIYRLLEDLLMWAKSQSGRIPFEPQEVNLNEIYIEILETLSHNASAKGISLNPSSNLDLNIFADANMLKTILRNLISNSIKFTNSGGQVNIYTEHNGSNITISVSDNGIGISSEVIGKLFDITQTHTTKGTADESGTGLGLFLCKDFVEKHGGKIWVNSEINKGTTFSFTIPC